MRLENRKALFLLLIAMAVSGMRSARAETPTAVEQPPRGELALNYQYVRANAPPKSCACFGLNGGGATFAWYLKPRRFALVADVDLSHAGSITSSGSSLTLSTFTAGGRYSARLGRSSLQTFGQVLVGMAHASGSLVEGDAPSVSNASAAFAANVGGGLDLYASRRFSLRLIEADYLVTTFNNSVNDRQNNLRLGAGVVLHF